MGGLGHYFESEGIASTQISLVRVHTENIKPPRALWVPFELGRPLGVPHDPEFQLSVLRKVLGLTEHKKGPVLEDFPEDAPDSKESPAPVVCPVSFQKRIKTVLLSVHVEKRPVVTARPWCLATRKISQKA